MVDRHQLVAQGVVGCMQRHGKGRGTGVAQAIHGGTMPDVVGDAPPEKLRHCRQASTRADTTLSKLASGLAHAHHHQYIADHPLVAVGAWATVITPQLTMISGRTEVAD